MCNLLSHIITTFHNISTYFTSAGGMWWADTPEELWPQDEESQLQIRSDWLGDYGDRRFSFHFDFIQTEYMYNIDRRSCLLEQK